MLDWTVLCTGVITVPGVWLTTNHHHRPADAARLPEKWDSARARAGRAERGEGRHENCYQHRYLASLSLSLSLSCCNIERDRDTNIIPLIVLLIVIMRAVIWTYTIDHIFKAYISFKRNYILFYKTRFSSIFPPCDYQWMTSHSHSTSLNIRFIFLFLCL